MIFSSKIVEHLSMLFSDEKANVTALKTPRITFSPGPENSSTILCFFLPHVTQTTTRHNAHFLDRALNQKESIHTQSNSQTFFVP